MGETEARLRKPSRPRDESLDKLANFFKDEGEPEAFMAKPDFTGPPSPPPPSVDPTDYEQIKPLLVIAASKYAESIGHIEQLVDQMVGELRATYGWTRPMLEQARPYFRKFIDDVNSGAITRDELEGKAAPSNIPEDRSSRSSRI